LEDLDMTQDSSASTTTCIGVDVGGTFTDIVLSDGVNVWRAKAPSSPGELGKGVLAACHLVAERAGTTLAALLPTVARFGLGTTAVTNTIASRTGRRVGLITTAGFEDLVPIARAMRTPTNGWLMPPESLIDREWIAGVRERIDRNGKEIAALDVDAVVEAAAGLIDKHQVEALVVSFLWSCVNDTHEQLAVSALQAEFPEFAIMSGSALLPVIREYERTQFALLNAYTSGALSGVDELVEQLSALGLRNPPLLVHSGGGSISVREGRRVPATLAESGPAAGVVAALAVCRASGVTDAVTGDVGGTSFDMSLITDGQPSRRSRGELMGVWTALSMVDIESVGAGGGSIGWVDPLGILRVGPRSAGAYPGPACYGRGGTDATVTDALVALGYIDTSRFLGGDMSLDSAAAVAACERLGAQLGTSAEQTAWGIWEVAKASMVRALRGRFAERGVDQRGYAMISMGGCGGLFSAAIAQELRIGRVLVPELASVLSAFGAASSDVRRERSHSVGLMIPAEPSALQAIVEQLSEAVREDLAADGVPPEMTEVSIAAEMRFHRQKFELPMDWRDGVDAKNQLRILEQFKHDYAARYGEGALASGAPVEITAMRAIGTGRTVQASLAAETVGEEQPAPIEVMRRIYQGPHEAPIDAAVVLGETLRPGHTIVGPAVVDAVDTTIWIPAGATARMDSFRTLDLEVSA
jgi:N-methylhydantoinase A